MPTITRDDDDIATGINEAINLAVDQGMTAAQVKAGVDLASAADTKADAAQTDATQAISDAATAQTTANTAETKAESAQTDATQALTDAATADSKAVSAQTTADSIVAKNPSATVDSVASAIAAVDSDVVDVGDVIQTTSYISGYGVGGNLYEVKEDASRPAEDGGKVIHCDGDKYLLGLFIDGVVSPNRYGADGTKVGDSAAVQAMIDSGVTLINFDCREDNYKPAGLTASTPVTFIGSPSVYGDRPTLEVDETVITIGTYAGSKINGFRTFSGFDVRVKGDITDGIFDMRSCRNFVFDETVEITSDEQYYIGSVVRLNRSYQCRVSCRNFAKGFSLVEFGDEEGGEVMDNISLRGALNQGNAVMMIREGISNCHNIDLANFKAREFASSDESVKANNGITYLDGSVSAGDTSLTVTDASQLKQGALGANDLIYVGSGTDAEYVRVASVSTNTITLDTPLRFDHSGDHNGSGVGQPVVFGAVFFTLEDVRGLSFNTLHIEAAFIGMHLRNMTGSVFGHIANTCRHMIVNDAGGDGNVVNSVSGGDAGWPDDISMMTMLECSAQGAFNPWTILSFPDISASYVTQEDLSGGDIAFWTLSNDSSTGITRASGTTTVPSNYSRVDVAMTGNTTTLSIEDGVFYKQNITVSLNQNDQGFRYVGAVDSSINLLKDLKPSMSPYASDVLYLEWNGSEWDEVSRSPRQNTDPIFSTGNSSLTTASNNLNSIHKDAGLMVLSTTNGKVYMATGSAPTDVWTALDGSGDLTPA